MRGRGGGEVEFICPVCDKGGVRPQTEILQREADNCCNRSINSISIQGDKITEGICTFCCIYWYFFALIVILILRQNSILKVFVVLLHQWLK